MSTDIWIIYGIGLYVILFLACAVGLHVWKIRQRGERPPLTFKLTRGPGESLRRRITKFDENFDLNVFLLALVAPLAGTSIAWTILHVDLPKSVTVWSGMAFGSITFLIVLFVTFRRLLRQFMRYRDDRLGYLGERAVGEALEPLRREGYIVFHDVPAEANSKIFNIDHVAIGPAGLFAIETKTRRKGRARPGYEDHKVAYDGRQLIWPWGEDDFGLRQASDRARWLGEWLNKMTGLGVAPQPVLVLPGWYVVPKGLGAVTVVNHKQLASAISRFTPTRLTPEQINLLARQLDERCRDVED